VPSAIILLDACIAINLAATGRLPHIAQTLDATFFLTRQAAAEVGYLRDFVNGELVTTPVNLAQHASDGTVQLIHVDPSEYLLYLELAAIVDDGEAATIAVAIHRNLQLATDDRKARGLCAERHIQEPLRTLTLIRTYADAARLEVVHVRELLIKIRDRASFQPPRSDPDHKWWHDHIEDA
jgi:predicted nucleic acid-binding protein